MAGFNYSRSALTALNLIRKFGQKIPIARYTKNADPVTLTETETVAASGNLDAVVLPASKGTIEAFDNRIMEALTQGKLRFMIAAARNAPLAPAPNDVVQFEGYYWAVLGSTPLAPAGVPVIYKLGMIRMSRISDGPVSTASIGTFAGDNLVTFANEQLRVF